MTQLVELQRALPKFQEAGIKLYAISYDQLPGLRAFAEAHDIEYPLLSDADSAVIRRFGILNTIIQPGEALYYGIPYPGTYVVDEAGIVTGKHFSKHIANRESPEAMIDGAIGRILIGTEEPQASGGDEEISVTAAFHGGGGVLKGGARRRLVVRFELADGLHIYGDPVPEGMVATQITVTGPDGFVVEKPVYPPTEPFRLPDLGVDLEVWSGTVDVVIPCYANSRLLPMLRKHEQKVAEVELTVRYQACNDSTCLIPRTETLKLEISIEEFVVLDFGPFVGSGQQSAGISTRHMAKLFLRGLVRRPTETVFWIGRMALNGARRMLRARKKRRH